MMILEKELLRMELQIGELIRIIANLNTRLNEVERKTDNLRYFHHIPFDKMNAEKTPEKAYL